MVHGTVYFLNQIQCSECLVIFKGQALPSQQIREGEVDGGVFKQGYDFTSANIFYGCQMLITKNIWQWVAVPIVIIPALC